MKEPTYNILKKLIKIINYQLTKRTNYDKILCGFEFKAFKIENKRFDDAQSILSKLHFMC